jgi:uncharacterized membrane protein YhaH (DUF805 family)
MDIYLSRSGSQEGPFSLEGVNELLRNGIYSLEDYAWHEGLENWTILRDIAGVQLPKQVPPPFTKSTDPSSARNYTSLPSTYHNQGHQATSNGVTFSESIKICFSKYATFEGRAGRSEYWWFYLFTVLLNWGAGLVGAIVLDQSTKGIFGLLVSIALLLPSLAVGARRLHDTGRSGWWLLLMLTCLGILPLIVWMATVGDKKNNRFGAPV